MGSPPRSFTDVPDLAPSQDRGNGAKANPYLFARATLALLPMIPLFGCLQNSQRSSIEETREIDVVIFNLEESPRYGLAGQRYDSQAVLREVARLLATGSGRCRIVVTIREIRTDPEFDAFHAALRTEAKKHGASLEFRLPRASYTGETRILAGPRAGSGKPTENVRVPPHGVPPPPPAVPKLHD